MVKIFNMSLPYDRDIITINLSPSLASQAPNVSRMTLRLEFGALQIDIDIGINRTIVSIIPSNDKRFINKWD